MVPFDDSASGSPVDLPGGGHLCDWPTREPFHPPAVIESLDHAAWEDFPVVESSDLARPRCWIYCFTHDQVTGRPTSDELDVPQSLAGARARRLSRGRPLPPDPNELTPVMGSHVVGVLPDPQDDSAIGRP